MSADLRALSFATADDSEEIARAELYGLLARLWIAPPDAPLLSQFAVAVTEAPQPGGYLEAPWQSLVAAMRATTARAAADEVDARFGGVGTAFDAGLGRRGGRRWCGLSLHGLDRQRLRGSRDRRLRRPGRRLLERFA